MKENKLPYKDAGISQTWEFTHPENRKYTGPLSNFTLMMKLESSSLMINHNIILVSNNNNIANYFVELINKDGNKFIHTWIVKKFKLMENLKVVG